MQSRHTTVKEKLGVGAAAKYALQVGCHLRVVLISGSFALSPVEKSCVPYGWMTPSPRPPNLLCNGSIGTSAGGFQCVHDDAYTYTQSSESLLHLDCSISIESSLGSTTSRSQVWLLLPYPRPFICGYLTCRSRSIFALVDNHASSTVDTYRASSALCFSA
jgi:hypothetical protein